jgi:hypothetical protein
MDDKMTGHVSALQLLFGDWDAASIRIAIDKAFPDTFHIVSRDSNDSMLARAYLKDAYRGAADTANFVESLKLGPSDTKDLLLDLARIRRDISSGAIILGLEITP